MLSVNTNTGAMVALQQLNATNRELTEVQTRINTGLKVAGPKDDGAVYAIAQNMRGEIAGFEAVKTALDNAVSVVDVGLAAGQSISDLLIEMKAKAVASADPSLTAEQRAMYNEHYLALIDQITTMIPHQPFLLALTSLSVALLL